MNNFTFKIIDHSGKKKSIALTILSSDIGSAKARALRLAILKDFDGSKVQIILIKVCSSWSNSSLDWTGQG